MTQLDQSQLSYLLLKKHQGSLSPDEQQMLDEWYDRFDTDQQHLAVFESAEHELIVKQRLLNRIMESQFAQNLPVKQSFYKRLLPWLSAAAVLIAVVGAGLIWKYRLTYFQQNEILISCSTQNGMLKEIKLEDGTKIWLNAGSKLRYPQHFDHSRREVYLEGEAYFDVFHDPAKPFIVHTNSLTTSVLGTAFSVTAYRNTPLEAVTVERGKVQVAHIHQVLGLLTPNRQVAYNLNSGKAILIDIDAASSTSWRTGRLQFVDMDLQGIAARLSRWYGYTFQFNFKNSGHCRYTASFDNKIPLNQLLKVLKAISLVNYKIDETNKTVTFLGSGCND